MSLTLLDLDYVHTARKREVGEGLEGVRVAELVDEPLGALCLLHDALLVVLTDGTGELVVVHGRAVLAHAPEARHFDGVLYLEDAFAPVQPADAGAVGLRGRQELLQELPQVDVRAAASSADLPAAGRACRW